MEFDTSNVEKNNQIVVNYEYLRLEPVVVFVVAFIFVIVLQSIGKSLIWLLDLTFNSYSMLGMLLHRVLTLEQIVTDKGDEFDDQVIMILSLFIALLKMSSLTLLIIELASEVNGWQ